MALRGRFAPTAAPAPVSILSVMAPRSRSRLRSRRASRSALLALPAALLAAASGRPARAAAELGGMEVTEVREAEHALTVRIEGLVARIDSRQVVINQGARDTEVIYAFDLPADAAVVGAEIALPDGRHATSASVDERAAFRFVPDDGAQPGAPDLGLLRLLDVDEDQGLARYEMRLYPVPAGRSATATVHWVAPLRYRDGRLSLRIPDRGGAANLVRERVDMSWRAPAGARGLRDIRSGSARLSATGGPLATARFSAQPGGDMVLEATPVFAPGQGLVAELATVPIDARRGALALSVLSPELPPAAPPGAERVVLVVDRSRSLGPTGLAAARAITDAILAAATRGAAAEVVVFDRRARAVNGRLTGDRAALRAAAGKSLTSSTPASGSDLGAALGQVASLLRREGAAADSPVGPIARGVVSPTLIVIVTDGMLPLELDSARARDRLGAAALSEARVTSVVLVPDGAPVPDLGHGPLADLARTTGGRVLAVRQGEARGRAARLWAEIGQPAPFESIQVDWRGSVVTSDSEAPARLESGEGFVLLGWYHGARPAAVGLHAELRGHRITARVRSAGAGLARAALPLTLMQRPAIELLPPRALEGDDAEDRARGELVRAADRAGVATRATALVLLDPRDGFARDRLAHARRWGSGQFRRSPPPAERRLGEGEQARAETRPDTGPAGAAARAAPAPRRTGELDRQLVQRLMQQHVVPRARACYQRALRREPKLTGTVVIELEMARGEVQSARVARSSAASSVLTDCLLDAAYATPVPQVALGEAGETIVVARYPLRFQSHDARIDVSPAADRPSTAIPDPDDPLGGL